MENFRRAPRSAARSTTRRAFTLLEILIVIGIIMLLAAILFPAFSRAQESARQANCASNLQQIYQAVRLYYDDEKRYPESLVALLPEGAQFISDYAPATAAAPTAPTAGNSGNGIGTANAPGYLKSSKDVLLCPSDNYDAQDEWAAYASYGPVGYGLTTLPPELTGTTTSVPPAPVSLYVWNYWGYNPNGYAYQSADEAGTATLAGSNLLVRQLDPDGTGTGTVPAPFNHPNEDPANYNSNRPDNVIKFSLSNRFAPGHTIITHCAHHRTQSAELADPAELYAVPEDSLLARDIVLRLDGSVKDVDVSTWKGTTPTTNQWQYQKP